MRIIEFFIILGISFSCASSKKTTDVRTGKIEDLQTEFHRYMIQSFNQKFKEEYSLEVCDSTVYQISNVTVDPIPYSSWFSGNEYVPLVGYDGQPNKPIESESRNEIVHSYLYNYDNRISNDSIVKINRGNTEVDNKIFLGNIYYQDSFYHSYIKVDFKETNFDIENPVYYFEFYSDKDSNYQIKIYGEMEKLLE